MSGNVRLNSFQKLFQSVKVCVHRVVGGFELLTMNRSQYDCWHSGGPSLCSPGDKLNNHIDTQQ